MGNFRELEVWKRARALAADAYKVSEGLPESERFGLKSQIQRSAVSIAANIAEGANRGSEREFTQFLQIALGSSAELETLILIAGDVSNWDATRADALLFELQEIQRMIRGLIRSLDTGKVRESEGGYVCDDDGSESRLNPSN